MQQKQQLQQQIKQFQQQVEQQLAYTQHTSAVAAAQQQQQNQASAKTSSSSTKRPNKDAANETDETSRTVDKKEDEIPDGNTSSAYELLQASQALQAAQALQQLDSSADIEPLTQDPTLLTTMDAGQLATAMQNCTMLDVNSQALVSGYKDGLQAAAVSTGSLHVRIRKTETFYPSLSILGKTQSFHVLPHRPLEVPCSSSMRFQLRRRLSQVAT